MPAALQQHAGDEQRLGAQPRHQHDVAHVGHHADDHHHREQGDARLDRRVPQGHLHVVDEEQEDAEDAGPGDQHGEVSAAAVAVEDDPGRQQRVRGARLPGREHDEQRDAGREEAHRRGRVPAVRRGVGEAVDQAEHPARHRCHARDVQPGARRLGLPAQQQRASGDPDRREEQVDIQAPPPRQVGGQRAAEQQPEARAAGRDRAVDAEGLGPFLHVGERRGQQRQGGRRQQRGEDPLAGTRRHQHGEAVRGAADGGGDREPGQPGQEGRLAADQVGQPPAEQQQATERQCVRGHDPLPVGVGETQGALGRRQREVHHGHIEDDHERGSADGGEDQPPPWVRIASVAITQAPDRHCACCRMGC